MRFRVSRTFSSGWRRSESISSWKHEVPFNLVIPDLLIIAPRANTHGATKRGEGSLIELRFYK
ncbi:hypothetical protein Hanom_Chr17g01529071 [Helianthus anomalus]